MPAPEKEPSITRGSQSPTIFQAFLNRYTSSIQQGKDWNKVFLISAEKGDLFNGETKLFLFYRLELVKKMQ